MLGVMRAIMPDIAVGKILIQRDHTPGENYAKPMHYYTKLPPDIDKRICLLCDPMLGTGGSANCAIKCLVEAGVTPGNIIFINLIGCKEGIEAIHGLYPDVKIVTSAATEVLNEKKYLVPGLGDFGDRYFGT